MFRSLVTQLVRSPDGDAAQGGTSGGATITPSGPPQVVPDRPTFIDNTTPSESASPITKAIAAAAERLKAGQTLGLQTSDTPGMVSTHPRDVAALGRKDVQPGNGVPNRPESSGNASEGGEGASKQPSGSTGDALAAAQASPQAAGQGEAPAEGGEGTGEDTEATEQELVWNHDAQRWQDKVSKQFVAGEPPEGVAIDPTRPQEPLPAQADALAELAEGLEGGATPAPAAEVVSVPGRNPGEPDIEIEVADKETADRLRQMRKGFMRGEEVRAARQEVEQLRATIESQAMQLAEVEDMIAAGPEVFLLERIKPDTQVNVAKQLVLEHWEKLAPEIEEWFVDPTKRREAWADARVQRVDLKDTVAQKASEQRRARDIYHNVKAIVPADIDAPRRDAFIKYAMRELSEIAQTRDVTPENAVGLLQPALALFGFSATPASVDDAPGGRTPANSASSRLGANATAAPNTGAPHGNAPASQTPAAAPAAPAPPLRPVITKKVPRPRPAAVTQARQNAAAIAPAGAGAVPVARPAMPKGLGLTQTIDFLRTRGVKIDVSR